MVISLQNFTQILHKSSFGFYIDRIPFDYNKQVKGTCRRRALALGCKIL